MLRIGRARTVRFANGGAMSLGVGSGYDPLIALGSDLLGYWDARRADTMTIGGGAVSSWRDLVAGYDAVQATGAAQPVYSASSFGGDPGLMFDGTDDCLTLTPSPFPSVAVPSEIWVLSSQDAVPPSDVGTRIPVAYGDAITSTRAHQRIVTSGVNRYRAACGNGSTELRTSAIVSVDFTGRHVTRGLYKADSTEASIDSSIANTVAVVPATSTNRVCIGASSGSPAAGFWLGQIAAILVTKPLDAGKAAGLRDWLMGRRRL